MLIHCTPIQRDGLTYRNSTSKEWIVDVNRSMVQEPEASRESSRAVTPVEAKREPPKVRRMSGVVALIQ